jgi:hypothetical protein
MIYFQSLESEIMKIFEKVLFCDKYGVQINKTKLF